MKKKHFIGVLFAFVFILSSVFTAYASEGNPIAGNIDDIAIMRAPVCYVCNTGTFSWVTTWTGPTERIEIHRCCHGRPYGDDEVYGRMEEKSYMCNRCGFVEQRTTSTVKLYETCHGFY